MHCYSVSLFFFPLYTFILKTQRKQVKLLPMILVFDPMLSETTSFGFLPFWRFAGVRLKWQLPFSQCMVKPEEELFASNALLCGTSFQMEVSNSGAASLTGRELSVVT